MKSKQSTFKVLSKLMADSKRYALLLFIVMLLAAVAEAFGLSLFLPLLSGLIDQETKFEKIFEYLDFILGSIPSEYKMLGLLAILVIAFLFKNALLVLHKGMSANFAMRLREQWSTGILSGYLRSPYCKVLDLKHGVMLNNTIIEPFQSSKAIIALLDLLCKSVVSVVISVMMLLINWKATLITAALGALIWLFIRNTTYNYSLRFGKKRLRINQDGSNVATESLGAIKQIKMLGQESQNVAELMDRLKQYTSVHTRFAIYTSLPDNLLELVVIFLISMVMAYFHLLAEGSLKELLPILGFFIIVGQRLFKYLSYVVTQRMKVTYRLPSLQMIYDRVTDHEDQEYVTKGELFTKLETDILFQGMCFSYDTSTPIFYHFSIRIPQNKMTVIVGPSGSGKSTLADLLMRLLTPQSGKIECNGKDIQEFSLESWRRKIGYVSQDTYLFNMTLREISCLENRMRGKKRS
ncbi:MAG: ABC transporter ATP-binding protein [Deltaproteobacteria bacterium]|nr:ABC transporter ATP-binding protein [Deltaproteobacteria bacterium]